MGVALCAQQQPEVSRADHKPNPVGVWRLILPVCSISMTTTIGRPGACTIMQCRVAGGPGAQPPAAPRVHGGDEAHLIVATGRVGLAWCHHEACRHVVERLFGGGSGSGVVEFHRLEGAVDVAASTAVPLGGGGLACDDGAACEWCEGEQGEQRQESVVACALQPALEHWGGPRLELH